MRTSAASLLLAVLPVRLWLSLLPVRQARRLSRLCRSSLALLRLTLRRLQALWIRLVLERSRSASSEAVAAPAVLSSLAAVLLGLSRLTVVTRQACSLLLRQAVTSG